MRQVEATVLLPIDQFPVAQGDKEIREIRNDVIRMLVEIRICAERAEAVAERIETAIDGERLFWTDADLAVMFECSELTIVRERRAGKIKFKRVAGKACYTRKHVEEYLASSN